MLILIVVVLLLCSTGSALAGDFTGKVVGITDGDTLTVLQMVGGEKIRLSGIDSPVRGRGFG